MREWCAAQFTIMPLLAFVLGKVFGLEAGLLTGVILVGTCPGGTSSNVITFVFIRMGDEDRKGGTKCPEKMYSKI